MNVSNVSSYRKRKKGILLLGNQLTLKPDSITLQAATLSNIVIMRILEVYRQLDSIVAGQVKQKRAGC